MKTRMEEWTPTLWVFRAKALGHPTTPKGTLVPRNSMLQLFSIGVAVSISKSPSRICRRKKHGAFLHESASLYYRWNQRNCSSYNVGHLLRHQQSSSDTRHHRGDPQIWPGELLPHSVGCMVTSCRARPARSFRLHPC